ncbi:MAG: thiamine-phosphate kinase [Cellvibrionaceae bacterium]|nr:thiamine-phosphate kinase [Cellvibrionaceae bacterium]
MIDTFFKPKAAQSESDIASGIRLGVGDDCALISKSSDLDLAVSVDTLIEGVHFPESSPPDLIAHRALAVAISDLAAMGAEPRYFTLALTLPHADTDWLAAFSGGLHEAATQLNCAIIGGDTTRGQNVSLSIHVMGDVAKDQALLRSGAKVGDKIYVTGPLGDGAAALAYLQKRLTLQDRDLGDYLSRRFYKPQPQVRAGLALRGVASAAIDISDGLLADLGHICAASDVAARIETKRLPLTQPLLAQVALSHLQQWALSGGDDYQLCFTVAKKRQSKLMQKLAEAEFSAHLIGEIIPPGDPLVIVDGAEDLNLKRSGYQHFA